MFVFYLLLQRAIYLSIGSSKVADMAKIGVLIVCLVLVAMDVVAGILSMEAQFAKNKVITLKRLRTFECKESRRKAFKLGLASAVLLALAHVTSNLLSGCICTSSMEELERSSTNRKIWFACLISSCSSDGVNVGWGHGLDQGSAPLSFKEKLMGEIPRAYTQAFNFMDEMEADVESDDGVYGLHQGLASVKLSKATKLHIRTPWSKALFLKVFGQSVRFNYSKLMALWKPTGRMDCVDLGRDFFLTRFSMKENYNAVIQKVWIRLKGPPIEYYEAKVLKEIGQTVGHVLRIDTHIATKSKGRYARLCVQLDLEKPLITAILIGRGSSR
nr:hypothetical protein CFP56_51130 [Quercus suber]